jgi:hypothetical protein
MGEHKIERDRPNRVLEPERPKHPMGWSCVACFHVAKDNRPGSEAMKCCRYPPHAQAILGSRGEFMGTVSVSAPVTIHDWCGEFVTPNDMSLRLAKIGIDA